MEQKWVNCSDCQGEGGEWIDGKFIICQSCEGEEGDFIANDNTYAGPEANTLHCEKCGDRIRLKMPMAVEIAVEIMRRYAALHQYCGIEQVFVVEQQPDR